LQWAGLPLGCSAYQGKGKQNKGLMSSQYIANYIKETEEWERVPLSDGMSYQEKLDNEREGEDIPSWMDEETLTARAYEGQGL
jgi:hypothetical protein